MGGGGGRGWNSRVLRKYSIKNVCVYSKSRIKTEAINKQNLQHFKMIN